MIATSREVAEAVHSEELGRFFRFRADGDSKAALKELEASAAKGNAEAMWELGSAMHTGELMLEKNPGKAFKSRYFYMSRIFIGRRDIRFHRDFNKPCARAETYRAHYHGP